MIKEWLAKIFGVARDIKNYKHAAYMMMDGMLVNLQAQIKGKSQVEIDNFFAKKRADLKTFFNE